METPPPNSQLQLQLTATTTAVAAAAWNIFGLLLSHRRPVRLVELASKCCCTPDWIQFLCSIPHSPLLLTANQFVTVSSIGFAAIAQYIANLDVVSIYLDLPEFVPRSLKNARSNDIVKTYCRKRKRTSLERGDFSVMKNRSFNEAENLIRNVFAMPVRFQNVCFLDGNMIRSINTPSCISSISNLDCQNLEKIMSKSSLSINSSSGQLVHETENTEHGYNKMDDNFLNWEDFGYLHRTSCQSGSVFHGRIPLLLESMVEGHKVNSIPCPGLSLPSRIMGNLKVSEARDIDIVNPVNVPNAFSSSQLEVDQHISVSQAERETVTKACWSLTEIVNMKRKEQLLRDFDRCTGHKKNVPINLTNIDDSHMYKPGGEILVEANNVAMCLDKSRTKVHLQCHGDMQKQLVKSSFKPKADQQNASSYREKAICQTMENCQHIGPHREPEYIKREKKTISAKQRLKCNVDQRMNAKEKMAPANSINSPAEQIPFPSFESFIIEEAEGSGGYGTVYKAKRKADGVTFAIKCPHVNANTNHVRNELKMLERFGGKNFVIKYEGSLKNGNSDCLVLEHVEHDRPEALKKEIDFFQLQWYGYCMFRALAGLHKQGIVHRDVKPGNFLFSRKVNKGYLIDFNLALDLHKKYGTTANSKAEHDENFDHAPFSHTKSLPPVRNRKFQNTRFPEGVNQNAGKGFMSLLPPGNLKRKIDQAKVFTDTGSRNSIKSQGADGSGITSAKDATSSRIPSAERLREPLPSQGRKELISLVQEALQGGNNESVNAPTSKRKRIAAPPAYVDSKFFYPTPMPLHASGVAICGAGSLKNKGDGKHKREGPCVGTKGFRAPEVLFRSLHQGPKIDIWSAGVTLLYLIIGRAPFIGDPDQNIKEIAKLKGSEDLWEVAKLHNHESSFPTDLLDVKYFSPVKLRDWCVRNTRRPYFLDKIPNSLLDLVDKCLTVNPRLRISAEEALRHEFFAPCHEALKKHRLRRQGLNIDSGDTVLVAKQSQTREAVS